MALLVTVLIIWHARAQDHASTAGHTDDAAVEFARGLVYNLPKFDFARGFGYESGLGCLPQNYAKAAKWYRKAAVQGYAPAEVNLGLAYYLGEGVRRDYASAAKWFRRAAAQGYAIAENNLSVAYSGGQGVPKDQVKAAKWRNKATMQGYAGTGLGVATLEYGSGKGTWGAFGYDDVPQDCAQAVNWYLAAAIAGSVRAEILLGKTYYHGWGVPRDYAEAYKWYDLAKAGSDLRSGLYMQASRAMALLEPHMVPAQIARAQATASAWFKAHPPLIGH